MEKSLRMTNFPKHNVCPPPTPPLDQFVLCVPPGKISVDNLASRGAELQTTQLQGKHLNRKIIDLASLVPCLEYEVNPFEELLISWHSRCRIRISKLRILNCKNVD